MPAWTILTKPIPSFISLEFKNVFFMIMLLLWILSSTQRFEAFIIVNNTCLINLLSSGDGEELD